MPGWIHKLLHVRPDKQVCTHIFTVAGAAYITPDIPIGCLKMQFCDFANKAGR